MNARVNISGLNQADVLIALFNWAQSRFSQDMRVTLSKEEAQEEIRKSRSSPLYFDYVKAVCIKVAFGKETIFVNEYDAYYGKGTAAKAIAQLRLGNLTPSLPDLPTFLGVLNCISFFVAKIDLTEKFQDSQFKEVRINNHIIDGFDFSTLKEDQSLVAICKQGGQNPVLYECRLHNQMKELRGFDVIEWFVRTKNKLELKAQTGLVDEHNQDVDARSDSPRFGSF